MRAGPIGEAVGPAVRGLRLQRGMTQAELTRAYNAIGPWRGLWHQAALSKVENGQKTLMFPEALVLAEALGITPADLMHEVERIAAERAQLTPPEWRAAEERRLAQASLQRTAEAARREAADLIAKAEWAESALEELRPPWLAAVDDEIAQALTHRPRKARTS